MPQIIFEFSKCYTNTLAGISTGKCIPIQYAFGYTFACNYRSDMMGMTYNRKLTFYSLADATFHWKSQRKNKMYVELILIIKIVMRTIAHRTCSSNGMFNKIKLRHSFHPHRLHSRSLARFDVNHVRDSKWMEKRTLRRKIKPECRTIRFDIFNSGINYYWHRTNFIAM